jgi:hypothetical protein
MNLGIIEGHENVLGRQMQARDDTTLLSNVLRGACAACSPSSLNEVALFEVRLI